jgi:hypothetical protein
VAGATEVCDSYTFQSLQNRRNPVMSVQRKIRSFFVVLGTLFLLCAFAQFSDDVETLYSSSIIDYAFPSDQVRQNMLQSGKFIPENNALAGVKVYNGSIYVTVPRWRPGVPSSLNLVDTTTGLLKPFPSWQFNDESNVQYVQSMEIDSRGWMWILDVGRLNLFADPSLIVNLQPKLIVYDLNKQCVILRYFFPANVVPNDNSFLNDLVIDEQNGFVYMSSTWGNGGLIVYDVKNNRSRRFDDVSLQGIESDFLVGGQMFHINAPSDGIALSPDLSTLYYSSISKSNLFSISTKVLMDFSTTDADFSASVIDYGIKGHSDGLTVDANGLLYFGDFENNAVKVWDTKSGTSISDAEVFFADDDICVWADTFAFDEKKEALVWTTNRLSYYLFNKMDFSGDSINFRILSKSIGAKGYLSTQRPYETRRNCLLRNDKSDL